MRFMRAGQVRNWLGVYFLAVTFILGAYVLLLGGTILLPIKRAESLVALQIIFPVLVGQLTIIYRWFASDEHGIDSDSIVPIPVWVVKGPPLLVLGVLVVTIGLMIIISMGEEDRSAWLNAATFQGMVTFCATILNATSVLIITKCFKSSTKSS